MTRIPVKILIFNKIKDKSENMEYFGFVGKIKEIFDYNGCLVTIVTKVKLSA